MSLPSLVAAAIHVDPSVTLVGSHLNQCLWDEDEKKDVLEVIKTIQSSALPDSSAVQVTNQVSLWIIACSWCLQVILASPSGNRASTVCGTNP
eukprot:3691134-Amphidinium_carterae.2